MRSKTALAPVSSSILVWPTAACAGLLARPIIPWDPVQSLPPPAWRPRAEVEGDAAWQQPIAYCLLRRGALVWTYRRRGGDGRLDGRASAGVGGHVDAGDGAGVDAAAPTPLSVIIAAARRELAEELVAPPALDPKPLAWIHEHDSPVGLVHVGLVCVAEWPAGHEPRVRRGERLESLGFRALPLGVDFERWSLLAVEALQWAS